MFKVIEITSGRMFDVYAVESSIIKGNPADFLVVRNGKWNWEPAVCFKPFIEQ